MCPSVNFTCASASAAQEGEIGAPSASASIGKHMTINPLSVDGRASDVLFQAVQGCMYGEVARLTEAGAMGGRQDEKKGPKTAKKRCVQLIDSRCTYCYRGSSIERLTQTSA